MNKRQAKRKLEDLLQRKPQISQPGRLVGHVLNEIGVEDDSTRKVSGIVSELLMSLAEDKVIELGMSGSVINSYALTEFGKHKLGLSESAAAQVLQPGPASKEKVQGSTTEAGMATCPKFIEMPQWERANLALAALREEADEQGQIYGVSLVKLLGQSLQISKSQAREVNRLLGQLGLRTSPQGRAVNQGVTPHLVDLIVGEVTQDMVEGSLNPDTATQEENVSNGTAATEPSALASLMDVAEELEVKVAKGQERIAQLQANLDSGRQIVDSLRIENGELAAQAARAVQAIEDLHAKIAELEGRNAALAEQLSESNRQLLSNRVEGNPRLMEILSRNGKA